MAEQFEYYIRQKGENLYEVAKFSEMSGGEQPLHVYNVMWNPQRGTGRCDCPAGTYRRTGKEDKHVKMVREWLATGKKTTAIRA